MPIHSMTGYASAQAPLESLTPGAAPARLGVEIRSVNSRFLDLSFKMPDEFRVHETALRERIGQHVRRGKVELRIHLEAGEGQGLQAPSVEWLQRMAELQAKVSAHLPQARPLSVADVLRLGQESRYTPEQVGPVLLTLMDRVLDALGQARAREGERLVGAMRAQIEALANLAGQAAPLIPELVEQQRQRFLQRWQEAMGLAGSTSMPEAAQDRALSEATAFAIRIDVAEELTRLGSHLTEMRALLEGDGRPEGIGKRLDFLIQELHREANTLGSKSATLTLSRISVDMKVLIEQLREQVQNLE